MVEAFLVEGKGLTIGLGMDCQAYVVIMGVEVFPGWLVFDCPGLGRGFAGLPFWGGFF